MKRIAVILAYWAIFTVTFGAFAAGAVILYKREQFSMCLNRTMPYYVDHVRCRAEVYGEE